MNKLINESTVSVLCYPTTSTGKSASTALFDMTNYRNVVFETPLHRLPDGKGEGTASLQVYESTASTWNGAVATAITNSVASVSLTSASDQLLQVEVKSQDMSVNNNKRYLNAYITLPTGVQICCTATKWGCRYEPQAT